MKKLLIFVLLLSGCSEEHVIEKKICNPFRMTISDALPVQFWVNGVETYNQKEVCGINSVCFCQPFNCDDEIHIQVVNDDHEPLTLSIVDEQSNEITSFGFDETDIYLPYTPTIQFSTTSFISSLGDWQNNNGSDASTYAVWQHSGTQAIGYSGGGLSSTKYLAIQRNDPTGNGWPPGSYTISIVGYNNSDGTQDIGLSVFGMMTTTSQTQIFPTGSTTLPDGNIQTTLTISFTTGQYWEYLAFRFDRLGAPGGGFDMRVALDSIEITTAPSPTDEVAFDRTIYSATFTPSDLDICDEKIILKIKDSSLDVLAQSDCLDIKTSHDCTALIHYDNAKDFAGLEYASTTYTPGFEFYIRIPAVFFHERNTEEEENFEESTENMVRLRNEIKLKRLLEVGFMPDYMHRKLLLILAHDTVEIDGESWIKRDPYEKEEPGNKRYPLKKASVLLTQKDYIKRNIL